MRVEVRVDEGVPVPPEVRRQMGERAVAALAPFAARIRSVLVRAAGGDQGPAHCHVVVDLGGGGGLAVAESGSCPRSSVERALVKMRSALVQELARRDPAGAGGFRFIRGWEAAGS